MNDSTNTNEAVDGEESWVVLEACPEPVAAQVLVGRLEAEGIPARVSAFSPLPGLEQNVEVQVPRAWLARARECLAAKLPSDEELTDLALHTPPEDEDAGPQR